MDKWKLELTRDMETYWSSWNIEIGGQPVLSEGVPMHVAETPGEGLRAVLAVLRNRGTDV